MNKVIISGNIGRNPELNYTKNGKAVTKVSVATNKRVKSGDTWQNEAVWHNVEVWGKSAEFVGKNVGKGNKVIVEGQLEYDTYEDKNGSKQVRAKIICFNFEMVGSNVNTNTYNGQPKEDFSNQTNELPKASFDNEEIPF